MTTETTTQTDAEIAAIANEVQSLLRRGDTREQIGQLIRERYYRNKVEAFRSRGDKDAGLRKIAAKVSQGGHVRTSRSALHRAVACAFQRDELGAETASRMSFSQQVELLRVEDNGLKIELARAAVAESLSVRKLHARVDERLGVEQSARRSAVAAAAMAAGHLRDRLQRLAKAGGLDGGDERRRIAEALHDALF